MVAPGKKKSVGGVGSQGDNDVVRLLKAIAVGDYQVAAGMLGRRPALAGVVDSRGRTMLMTVAMFPANSRNGWELARLLLDMGAEVNARDLRGMTALAYTEDVALMRLLLGRGADVHARDRRGNPVLMHAAVSKNAALVRELVAHGAEVNAVGEDNQTALIACVRRRPDLFVVRELIAAGADVGAVDDEGESAISIVQDALAEIDNDEQELMDEHELILEALKRASGKRDIYNSLNVGTARVGPNTEFIDKDVMPFDNAAAVTGKRFFYNTGNVGRDGVIMRAFNAEVLDEMQKSGRSVVNPFTRAVWPIMDKDGVRRVLKKVDVDASGAGGGWKQSSKKKNS